MTAKHRDPAYLRAARIIRSQVAAARRAGADVICRRCGRPIDPEQAFDVGHADPDGGHDLSNLGPEHRYKTGWCIGNRADGGRLGAARRNAKTTARTAPATITRTGILPW